MRLCLRNYIYQSLVIVDRKVLICSSLSLLKVLAPGSMIVYYTIIRQQGRLRLRYHPMPSGLLTSHTTSLTLRSSEFVGVLFHSRSEYHGERTPFENHPPKLGTAITITVCQARLSSPIQQFVL